MLLLIQFPIADLRSFLAPPHPRLPTPGWPKPNTYRRFVRNYGRTQRRLKDPELGVWQDELYFSDASRGIRFPLLEKQKLGPVGVMEAPRGAFRRLFCDGGPSVRVEIAVEARAKRKIEAKEMLGLLKDFLNLPTHVMRHSRANASEAESPFKAKVEAGCLYDQGALLAQLWLNATTKFGSDETESEVDACAPMVLVGYSNDEIDALPEKVKRLDKKVVEDVELGYLNFRHQNNVIGVWFLNLDSANEDQRRKLRIAILRLNAEQQVLARVAQRARNNGFTNQPGDPNPAGLMTYLNKATDQLFGDRRFGVDQPILRETIAAYEAAMGPGERQLIRESLKELKPATIRRLDGILTPKGKRVFVCFSRKDGEKWLDLVKLHLGPLCKAGFVEFFADTEIEVGEDWHERIQQTLSSAALVILLVGPGLFNSDYVVEKELPIIIELFRNKQIELIPVFVATVSQLVAGDLFKIQGINRPEKPLDVLSTAKRNQCMVKLVDKLGEIMGIVHV